MYKMLIAGSLTFAVPAFAATIHVDSGASGNNDGRSWQDAYASLAMAIERATANDEIWVAAGTYEPIALKTGVAVYGGFGGTELVRLTRNPEANKTYISGAGRQRAVESSGNDASTVLDGFTIREGVLTEPDQAGGGLLLRASDAMFVRCDFTGNSVLFAGGAVANYGGGSPLFVNCRFHGNGGADNKPTPVGGGAVFNHDGAPAFVNCLFYGNRAGDGGAVVSLSGKITFINCTFTENQAARRHGGAIFDNPGQAVIRNCILWANRAALTAANEIYNHPRDGGSTSVSHSNVKGGWPGTGNISADPLFVDASARDYRLQAASPCKDVASGTFLPRDFADINADGNTTGVLPKDLALKGRISGEAVDMGAFEWHPPDN